MLQETLNVNTDQIIGWITDRKWVPLIAVAVGFAVRLVKDDGAKLPAPWRAPFGLFCSMVFTACVAIVGGTAWQSVVENALLGFVMSVISHETVVEGMRGGVEIPLPFLKPQIPISDSHPEIPPPADKK